MGPTPCTIVLYNNSKLFEVIRLYGCQDDSKIICSSRRRFTYTYIYLIQIHVQKHATDTLYNLGQLISLSLFLYLSEEDTELN